MNAPGGFFLILKIFVGSEKFDFWDLPAEKDTFGSKIEAGTHFWYGGVFTVLSCAHFRFLVPGAPVWLPFWLYFKRFGPLRKEFKVL